MIYINRLNNKIVIKKNSYKSIIKLFILYESFIILLMLFSSFSTGTKHLIYTFGFFNIIIFIALFISIFSYYANEKMEITPDEIIISYYALKIPIYKVRLRNDNSLKIFYDEKMKGSIKFIFKLNYSIFYPGIYRLMKFEINNSKYSFGYNLERDEYEKINKIIQEERLKQN